MTRFIAFGIAAGAGFQALRQYPPDSGPLSASAMWLALTVAVVCAYLGGRARNRGGAVAVASSSSVAVADASASAQNRVQLVIVNGQGGAASQAVVPDWAESAPRLSADTLEGFDLAEFSEESHTVVDEEASL